MSTKYLRTLSAAHWLKVLLPIYFLSALFFLNGFVASQVDMFFSKTVKESDDIFKVELGGTSAKFASALIKERKLALGEAVDYSGYLSGSFISKLDNDYQSPVQETEKTVAETVEEPVDIGSAPAFRVSSVFMGKTRRFAVINDTVFKPDEVLESGETIVEIDEGRVLLDGKWGRRWLYVAY